jgi:Mrp family chromosome partitioning ATPase
MEEIREALERARANASPHRQRRVALSSAQSKFVANGSPQFDAAQEFELERALLRSKRIVGHDHMEVQSAAFDMLRTQVLQSMDAKEWRFLGITSPTPGCGKTVTAVNLALSIARLRERTVLLMDLDLRKPQVASDLGLKPQYGTISILESRSTLSESIIQTRIDNYRMMVLPTESRVSGSSDWMASSAMSGMLEEIKGQCQWRIVLVDLPPLLASDDVLSILPQLDCVLLVTAVGTTKIAEINESINHLQSTELVRVVLNKAPPSKSAYYY